MSKPDLGITTIFLCIRAHLRSMKQIKTKDSSLTFYNARYKDHYHTKSGAREEAFEKHAKALNITEKSNPVIFDICFGLGYNTAAALDLTGQATIYCFENDKEILAQVLKIDQDFRSWKMIKEFIGQFLKDNKTTYEKGNIRLVMLFGDARKTIKKVETKADFVFFDPFSPAKVPEMWTKEFFKDIYKKMKPDSKLSTYSYARFVRENLEKAGFRVIDGVVIGRRSPSTIAIRSSKD
ncbi:hypothetical protein GF336_06525 [Candidatus Woesearchaeota archaeon]|nr:hypothetical protein [Candidatus Woesearchaeota archaeon]